MNLESVTHLYFSVNPPATEQAVGDVEHAMGKTFPVEFRDLLLTADGFQLGTGAGIHGTDEIEERNSTLEVDIYAPGYLVIGGDGGGLAVVLHLTEPGVYKVHQGVMDSDYMKLIASSLQEWVEDGCEI